MDLKDLLPNEGSLVITKTKDGYDYNATIFDAELDPIDLNFIGNDDCVSIDTSEIPYIILSSSDLMNMLELLNEAESHCEKYLKYIGD